VSRATSPKGRRRKDSATVARSGAWRSRIVERGEASPTALVANPRNWRGHPPAQQAALAGLLDQVGWVQDVVVNKRSGHLVDGHLRVELARSRGETSVPVVYVDLDEAEEALVLASLDPLGSMATADPSKLEALLRDASVSDAALRAMLDELAERSGIGAEAKGGLTDPDDVPEPPEKATTQRGDLYVLGDHRLLCGDSGSPEDLDRLLDGGPVHLLNTDPPYNVRVEPRSNNAIAAGLSSFQGTMHHQAADLDRHPEKSKPTHRKMRAKDRPLENDFMSDEAFREKLRAWFGNAARVLLPGRGFFIWGGYSNIANYPPALVEAGLYFSQAIIWVKEHPVLTRKDFMGNHEWCQPPDTKVLTPEGEVPIASLRDGDRVVSYSTHHAMILGRRRGYSVRRAQRPYRGRLHGVVVAGKTTWATDGHIWSARMAPASRHAWCVYLMRRGDWWRVGKSKLYTSWGFGPKQRLMFEGGEDAWILSLHGSNADAATAEQMVSVRYGIPTTYWRQSRLATRPETEIRRMYDSLDANMLAASAYRALLDHGRRIEHPLLRRDASTEKVGARVPFLVRTCNLLPGVMAVPVPTLRTGFVWTPLDEVLTERFDGMVHSLEVEKTRHYVADGMVTHNCFYGWREGAAHYFAPDINNATDVWSVKKVSPQKMVHLTEKPVELATLAMKYCSRPGETVLDLFGGSGSTLIGAEQMGRKARLIEIDPLYADVVVARWEKFTGKKAERVGAKESA